MMATNNPLREAFLFAWTSGNNNLVPAIDAGNTILAETKPCYDNNDHHGQVGFLRCGGCNPYGRNDWQ